MRQVRITLIASVMFAFSAACHASIVWFPGEDIPIPTNPSGVVVNLQTAASTLGDDAAGADANFFFGGFGIGNDADSTATVPTFQPVRIGTGFFDSVANLPLGATVGAASTYASGFGGSVSHIPAEFTAGTPGYLGFSLETGSGLVYGWMRVTLNPNTDPGVIHEWAYDDSGASIMVGSIVPEPATSALSILALSVLMLRRRR